MKTYLPKESEIERKWYVVDAEGQVLGRLAVKIANVLRGRLKPMYTPHLDTGDFVVVVNAEKVKLTGNKESAKTYQRYSGWMGGHKVQSAEEVRTKTPRRIVRQAVWGMIPHNRLGRQQFRKLKVFEGPDHRHQAQKPEPLEI